MGREANGGGALRRALVVGGNGGIGGALVNELRHRAPGLRCDATYRRHIPDALREAARWWQLDLHADDQIDAWLDRTFSDVADAPLDAVVVASGFLHDDRQRPERSSKELRAEALARAMQVNATGPLIVASRLAARLRDRARPPARILLLSAKVGSIADNHLGGWYAYRMSKAALNMGVRCLGIELARLPGSPLVCAVHPGTTHTALSEPFSKRGLDVVSPEQTARRLTDFLLAMGSEHQGGFFHWDGTPLPG